MSTSQKQEEAPPQELSTQLPLENGVTAAFENNLLTIKGPKGTVGKDFSKIRVVLSIQGDNIRIKSFGSKREDAATMNTARSVIRNMVVGVTKGFTYRLKVVYAHFPVTVKVKGKQVHIENFYGERSPRVAQILGDCRVSIQGDDVLVHGISAEHVGQTAANIEQATRVRRKDQRVFLDGVYVYDKKIGE